MKLTGCQAQWLLQIAIGSLRILGAIGGLSTEKRLELVNEIMKQQGTDLVDLGPVNHPEEKQ